MADVCIFATSVGTVTPASTIKSHTRTVYNVAVPTLGAIQLRVGENPIPLRLVKKSPPEISGFVTVPTIGAMGDVIVGIAVVYPAAYVVTTPLCVAPGAR